MKFYQGLEIEYKQNRGKVNFIGNAYITLTLDQTSTDLLIYASQWKDVFPISIDQKEKN